VEGIKFDECGNDPRMVEEFMKNRHLTEVRSKLFKDQVILGTSCFHISNGGEVTYVPPNEWPDSTVTTERVSIEDMIEIFGDILTDSQKKSLSKWNTEKKNGR